MGRPLWSIAQRRMHMNSYKVVFAFTKAIAAPVSVADNALRTTTHAPDDKCMTVRNYSAVLLRPLA